MSVKKELSESKVEELTVRYEATLQDPYQLVIHASGGVSVDAFFDLLEISAFTRDELANLLDVSFKTISRYRKENKNLNVLNSEQILKLIRLYKHGTEVFGGLDAFNRWLRKPSHGLGNIIPTELMRSSGGIDLIDEELSRIEYGSFA
jgi:putative toxin-antitoxin system antitoxin component (TIGR02293 family)